MKRTIGILLLAMAFGIGTWLAGWITVPTIGAIYAASRRDIRAPLEAGLGAMAAWLVLLAALAPFPAFRPLVTQLGQIFPIPGVLLMAFTVLWAGLLATSAARLTLGIIGTRVSGETATAAQRGLLPDRR